MLGETRATDGSDAFENVVRRHARCSDGWTSWTFAFDKIDVSISSQTCEFTRDSEVSRLQRVSMGG